MTHRWHEIAFTPAVERVQALEGSRAAYAKASEKGTSNDRFTEREAAFIAGRDGFYLASVSETGWPYVQFRGGPPGFVRVLDDTTLGWADFRGNQQYVTVGNASVSSRVSLFFMDYPNRRRLKLFADLRFIEAADDPRLAADLKPPLSHAVVQRLALVTLAGFDWNCPQHIPQRYTVSEMPDVLAPIQSALQALERENAALKRQLGIAR